MSSYFLNILRISFIIPSYFLIFLHFSSYFLLYWPWVLHIYFIFRHIPFIFPEALGHREIPISPPLYRSWDSEKIRAISSMDMKHVSVVGTWTGIIAWFLLLLSYTILESRHLLLGVDEDVIV